MKKYAASDDDKQQGSGMSVKFKKKKGEIISTFISLRHLVLTLFYAFAFFIFALSTNTRLSCLFVLSYTILER